MMQSTKSAQAKLSTMSSVHRLEKALANQKQRKRAKMNWFDRWFMNKLNKVQESQGNIPLAMSRDIDEDINFPHTVRFNITSARGGYICTVSRYDERKDRNDRIVYVIDESEDISKKVADIVSMEMLRS